MHLDKTLEEAAGDPFRATVACLTDRGLRRTSNQDAALAACGVRWGFLAVADGMGGHDGGADASRAALHALGAVARGADAPTTEEMVDAFAAAARAVADASPCGGTTLVSAVIAARRLVVYHVGDSRAYLVRAATASTLTQDDRWVAQLVSLGLLSPAQARVHPRRNVLTRAIGQGHDSTPHRGEITLREGDRVVLCTDGLHGVVDDAAIARAAASGAAREVCARLVEAARAAGGPDNIGVSVAVL